MSEEFMRVTVNNKEFVVMKQVTAETDKSRTFRFTTEVDGKERGFTSTLESSFEETMMREHGLNAEEELMLILEYEFKAELQKFVDNPV